MPLPPYDESLMKLFIAKNEIGKPDSLKRPVRIAFTITPHEPDGTSHPYSPIATYVTSFTPDGVGRAELKWGPRFHPISAVVSGKTFRISGTSGTVDPDHAVTLAPPLRESPHSQWGEAVPLNSGLTPQGPSCVIKNESGSKKDIILATYTYRVAYHPLESGRSITVPLSWEVQAYTVGETITDRSILGEEDLKSPIFSAPVLWDALPAVSRRDTLHLIAAIHTYNTPQIKKSMWMLIQDNDGTIRLNNDEFNPIRPVTNSVKPEVASPVQPEVELVVKKDPLSELLERFALMEQSIARIQDDVAAGQKTLGGIQKRVSALERGKKKEGQAMHTEFTRSIAVVEANAATLASSFDQNRDRLSEVQKAITGTQQLLSGLEKSSHSRISTLEEAATRTQDHVVAVEKAVHHTQDTVSIVQQLVLARQSSRTPVTSGPVPPSQVQHIGEDGIRAVEARVEKLEKAVQEQRKVLRAVDRRLPDMDARAAKLELDLSAVQISLTGLGLRVSTIEHKSGDDDGGTEGSASSSTPGSPVTFPNHLANLPTAI